MNSVEVYNETIFDSIKHLDESGNEYWSARELQQVLGYSQWRRFDEVIYKAKNSCQNSGYDVFECFANVGKTSKMPNGGVKIVKDYKLNRHACYIIAQNGDSRKKVIALAQTYFAVKTRKQELSELEYEKLTEDEKRFYQRNLTKKAITR